MAFLLALLGAFIFRLNLEMFLWWPCNNIPLLNQYYVPDNKSLKKE